MTRILEALGRGERQATGELLPLVYDELRRLAARQLARESPASNPDDDLLALNDALNRLAKEDPVAAKVVELHQFADLGHEETATALGITVYRARQKWTYARAWLRDALGR